MAGGYINRNPKVVDLDNLSKQAAFTSSENSRQIVKQDPTATRTLVGNYFQR